MLSLYSAPRSNANPYPAGAILDKSVVNEGMFPGSAAGTILNRGVAIVPVAFEFTVHLSWLNSSVDSPRSSPTLAAETRNLNFPPTFSPFTTDERSRECPIAAYSDASAYILKPLSE